MKKTIGVAGLFLFVNGCGVFGADDPSAPEATTQEMPPVEGAPVESELTEKHGVFVVAGKEGGDGTRARPFGAMQQAIAIAKVTKKRVYACAGTFREAIVLTDGVSMVGGLDCTHPSWSLGSGRSTIASPTSPAMLADRIATPTRIERFDVIAPAAIEPGASSFGLFATDSPALAIVDASIVAQSGADGADGAEGIQLVESGASRGKDASTPYVFAFLPSPAPAPAHAPGATSACAGEAGHDGEAGGYGGSGGVYEWRYDGQVFYEKWTRLFNDPAYGSQPGETRSGADGARGTDGASATSAGVFTREGFAPADGTPGTAGQPGKGGSGGGGWPADIMHPPNRNYAYGADGASGGAGGCPGLAGQAGRGGGASVAAILFASPIVLENVSLTAGDGGRGGKGTFGSAALAGGQPGGRYHASQVPAQSGGRGGEAGVSGSGAGGPSIALVHQGGAPRSANATSKHASGGAGVSALTSSAKTVPSSAAGAALDVLDL